MLADKGASIAIEAGMKMVNGFRRNMYGLRWIGRAVALITSIALGLDLFIGFSSHEQVAVVSIALEAVNVIMLVIWIVWVNEKGAEGCGPLRRSALRDTRRPA